MHFLCCISNVNGVMDIHNLIMFIKSKKESLSNNAKFLTLIFTATIKFNVMRMSGTCTCNAISANFIKVTPFIINSFQFQTNDVWLSSRVIVIDSTPRGPRFRRVCFYHIDFFFLISIFKL